MSKPKVYLAGPFFNPLQVQLISDIEHTLYANNFPFYSPRLHSGSAILTSEQRKQRSAWDPIFESNVEQLGQCSLMITVLDYLLPQHRALVLCDHCRDVPSNGPWDPELRPSTKIWSGIQVMEQPDLGTAWEMGAMRVAYPHKPVIGFTSRAGDAAKMNLMLSHGVHGLIRSIEKLDAFLAGPPLRDLAPPPECLYLDNASAFDWRACEGFTGEVI